MTHYNEFHPDAAVGEVLVPERLKEYKAPQLVLLSMEPIDGGNYYGLAEATSAHGIIATGSS